MIKKHSYVWALLCVSSMAYAASENAQNDVKNKKDETAVSAAPVKSNGGAMVIRVVHGQKVVGMLDESKGLENDLIKEREDWEKRIKRIESQIKEKVDLLQAKAKTAVSEALEPLKESIEKLQRDGKNLAQEAEATLKRRFESGLAKINTKIKKAIDDIAAKNGYDLVLMQEAGVVFASEKADITQDIIDAMNKEYKGLAKK